MKRSIFTILLSCICLGLTFRAYGQYKPFEKYRFEDGGYSVVGVFEHIDDHPLQKKVGEFYTDDLVVLNALKKNWVFTRPQHQYACGYHYLISVLRNGNVLDDFSINLECHELALGDRSYYFDWRRLEDFAGRFKPLYRRKNEFTSVSQAREFWKAANSNQDFVYAWKPEWLEFEGTFQFQVKCIDTVRDCIKDGDKMLPQLNKAISAAYPGEWFELEAIGGTSSGELFVLIKCNESLERRFDLYDRWNKQAFGKWEPYPLTLYSYWKHPVEENKKGLD
jgi:hypothetical protein